MKPHALFLSLVLGLPLAAPAVGDEYFAALDNLLGRTYTVEGDCSGDLTYGAQLNDTDNTSNYIYIYAPDPLVDEWVEACNGDGEMEPVKLELFDNYGSLGLRHAGPGKAGDAQSIEDFAETLTADLAGIDTISGWIIEGWDALGYTGLATKKDGYASAVYHDNMPKRTTAEYLYACYDICEKVTFQLEPLVATPSGGMPYLYASGWRLAEGDGETEEEEITGGKDKDR